MIQKSLSLPKHIWKYLAGEAKDRGVPVSELLRSVILDWIEGRI